MPCRTCRNSGDEKLHISKQVVDYFEGLPSPIKEPQGLRLLMISTTLHEFLHYADTWDFASFKDQNGNLVEEGIAFEFDAFGQNVSLPKKLSRLVYKKK